MRPAPLRRLVLFHGLASTPKEFGLLVHPLRRLGVTLDTPEVRGYSHGSLAEPSRWQDWVSAAADTVEAIAARSPEPFVLGGLCTGAMLAVAVAVHRSQPKVQGLALLSPLFSYDGWGLPWWYGLRHWAYLLGLGGRFSMRERPPYGLKNERVRQWVRKQMETEEATMVGPAQVSLQVVRESERLSRHVIESLRHLSQPMLVLHARQDEICDFQSVKAALSSVAPQRLRMRVLENSYHLITADNDRQQVADSLDCFLKSAVPSPPCMAAQSAVPTTDVDGLRAATPSDLWTLSTNSSN
jgi:carboxylesterase